MAIVKATFTRSRGAAKAYIKYITHRPGKDGEQIRRELFGADGQLTKRQAYQMIDRGGRRTVFYRIVISPDPGKEDTRKDLDLREITEQTMMQLQDRFKVLRFQYLASIHADHTAKRHIHILALAQQRLNKGDLAALRTAATDSALSQRQDLDQHQAPDRQRQPQQKRGHRPPTPARGEGQVSPFGRLPSCPNCGPGSPMERHGRFFECQNCGLAVRRSFGMVLEIKAGPGLELSLGEEGAHD